VAWRPKAALEIEIDAAILNDGTLLGADRSDLAADFTAYFRAKQDLYRELMNLLDGGSSFEEAFRPIKSILSQRPEPYRRNPSRFYPRLAAQDAQLWRERYGEASVNLMKQSMQREPFIVRRRPGS
jgi:hypothetical protein